MISFTSTSSSPREKEGKRGCECVLERKRQMSNANNGLTSVCRGKYPWGDVAAAVTTRSRTHTKRQECVPCVLSFTWTAHYSGISQRRHRDSRGLIVLVVRISGHGCADVSLSIPRLVSLLNLMHKHAWHHTAAFITWWLSEPFPLNCHVK